MHILSPDHTPPHPPDPVLPLIYHQDTHRVSTASKKSQPTVSPNLEVRREGEDDQRAVDREAPLLAAPAGAAAPVQFRPLSLAARAVDVKRKPRVQVVHPTIVQDLGGLPFRQKKGGGAEGDDGWHHCRNNWKKKRGGLMVW